MLPWEKVNPSVQWPTQTIGNQGQRLGPQSHWVLLGAIQQIPGLYFQSEPGQWMDWLGWYVTSNVHLHWGIDAPCILVLLGIMDGPQTLSFVLFVPSI